MVRLAANRSMGMVPLRSSDNPLIAEVRPPVKLSAQEGRNILVRIFVVLAGVSMCELADHRPGHQNQRLHPDRTPRKQGRGGHSGANNSGSVQAQASPTSGAQVPEYIRGERMTGAAARPTRAITSQAAPSLTFSIRDRPPSAGHNRKPLTNRIAAGTPATSALRSFSIRYKPICDTESATRQCMGACGDAITDTRGTLLSGRESNCSNATIPDETGKCYRNLNPPPLTH